MPIKPKTPQLSEHKFTRKSEDKFEGSHAQMGDTFTSAKPQHRSIIYIMKLCGSQLRDETILEDGYRKW